MPARKTTVTESPRAVRPRATAASVKPVTRTVRHKKATTTVEAEPLVAIAEISDSISLESIAKLAYSYWEARGYQPGDPSEDWFRAERELGIASSVN